VLTLVIDTATAACSVALVEGAVDSGRVVACCHEVVGRGHAERLMPMVAGLPGGGRADAILVDCGPGSFTGVRVGLAAAIGLGIGWGAPVCGYSSTALIAAAAFVARHDLCSLVVVLEGGHGELFMQAYDQPFAAAAPLASLTPRAVLDALAGRPAFGSGAPRLLALDPQLDGTETLPDAAQAILLPRSFATLPPRPIYGRAPDAQPQGARA